MVMRALPEDMPHLRTSLGLGTCACVKVRARVEGEGGLRTHLSLGSFHSLWTSEAKCRQGHEQMQNQSRGED